MEKRGNASTPQIAIKGFVPMVYGVLAHDNNLALLLEMIDG